MSIGTTIKKLRKDNDLTQEQLAEYLGVSAQAVSQWECDKSAPDISQLPVLANIFEVTTDELLEVDITKANQKIDAYMAENDRLYRSWKLAEMVELARKACAEFPANHMLRYSLAWSLGQAQNVIRTKKENLDEAISIAEKILQESADIQTRLRTISLLSSLNHWNNNDDKALDYANQLPGLTQTRGFLIGRLGLEKGEKGVKYAKSQIKQYYNILQKNILVMCNDDKNNIAVMVKIEDRIAMLKELLQLQAIVFGKDLLCENMYAVKFCYSIADLALRIDNTDEAIDYLEKAYQYAKEFEKYNESSTYSSAMLSGVATNERRMWSKSALEDLRDELTDARFCDKYKKLQGNPRYEQLLNLVLEK